MDEQDRARLETEDTYTSIFNAASDAILIHDIETGEIIDVNERACEMFCYPKEELLKIRVGDISSGEPSYTQEEAMMLVHKAASGESQLFEWYAKDKAGRLFWIEVNLKRAVIGGKYRLLAVVRDITERKETEEFLNIAHFSIEHAADAIFWIGPDARILYVNKETCKSLGYSEEELLNMTVHDIDPNFGTDVWPGHWREIKERGSFSFESKHRRKDGTIFPVEITVNYMEYEGRQYNFAFVRDITERKKQEETLIKRGEQLEILSRTSQHINAILDIPIITRTLVAAAMELVGAKGGTAGLLIDGKMVFNEYNRDGNLETINYVFDEGNGVPGCTLSTMKPYISNDAANDPKIISEKRKAFNLYNLVNVPIITGKGEQLGCFEIHNKEDRQPFDAQDVFMLQGLAASAAVALENAKMLVERKQSEEALQESGRFLTNIFSSIQDGISILDKDMNIIRVNPTMERWYSHAMPLVGKKCYEAYHLRDERCQVCPTYKTLMTGSSAYEVVPKTGEGGKVVGWLDLYSFPLIDAATGQLKGVIEYIRDISDRKKAEEEREKLNWEIIKTNKRLQQLALKDAQTGLYNHRYLSEFIEPELYRSKRYSHPVSVVMLDIDYFKSINDLYGHDFGDLVIKQFAAHLKKLVRRYDIVVRFGGEEFVIISPGVDRLRSMMLAQRLLDAIGLYNFGNEKHVIKLKVSIAVTSYPDDDIRQGIDLINLADKILNKVKEDGGNRVYSSENLGYKRRAASKKILRPEDFKALEGKIEKLTKKGRQSLIESIFAFAKTIELRDHYTGEHVESTVHYATAIARALKVNQEDVENIKEAAVLHDLGKIGISDKILLKKSKLTKKEFEEIKKHPLIAADIMRPIQFMHDIIPLILYHHERWDGKGYASGLKGEEIPLGARIIAIADVYQALISKRPYRKAYPKKKAIKIIMDGAGTQFDPKIVNAFLKIVGKNKKG